MKQHCWKCREAVELAVCVSCGTIQPPPAQPDFFALLGLERRFFLAGIDEAHRAISRKVHPDRFARKAAVERRMSLQWTAAINTARRVLNDPVTRARYLATGSAQVREDKKIVLEPDFLEEIFELQMLLADDEQQAKRLALQQKDELMQQLHSIFTQWEEQRGSLEEVEVLLAKLKYFTNIGNA